MKPHEMIKAIQKTLGVQVDGRAGPETWAAIYGRIVQRKTTRSPSPPPIDAVDSRSEKNISTLLPEVQTLARALVHKCANTAIQIKIISGLRTYEEQDHLYAQGRTTPGKKVTNARAGYSNHNFGIAFDIGVFEGTRYLPESSKYAAVGALGVDLGLEWGGNWKNIVDQPHFQLRPLWAQDLSEREMLAGLRERLSSKRQIFA